jgi:hypothetical protein
MIKILIILSTLVSFNALAEEIPGKALLDFFRESCQKNSQWTQAALADAEALVRGINAMNSDPDCASASGAIAQLNGLQAQLITLEKLNETKNGIATINAQEQELMIQLSRTGDADVQAEINAVLRGLQLERAKLLSQDRSGERLSGADKVSIMSQIAMSANASFQQIATNQRCLQKNPSLLHNATSIVAGVGSAVTLVNPAIGIAMTAGATFTKVAMDGIRNSRNARDVRRLTDSTVTLEAYTCALKTMSERWCQMKDAESFLRFRARNRWTEHRNPELSQAITLNDREIPTMLDWLNKIRNGVTSQTTADSDRRNAVLTRELIVRARSDRGLGLIEQNRRVYESLRPEDQWRFLRTIVIQLAPQNDSMHGNARDPLNDIYAASYSPYYLIGLNENSDLIPRNCNGICSILDWEKPASVNPTLDSVKSRYIDWTNRAVMLVNRELTEVQQPDPLQTISLANI